MHAPVSAVRLVHPFPSVLVTALTVAILPLADSDAPAGRYLALGLGMLLFQFAIGVTNDIVDVDEDRRVKPWKPLVRGAVSLRVARVLAAGFASAGLLLTLTLPPLAWAVGAIGLATGLAYDLWLKRTALSWLPYSVALPLVPIWVHVAVGAWWPALWWALPLGALLGLALHFANQAPDVGGTAGDDGPAGDDGQGLPGRLGARTSRAAAVGLFAVVAAVVALLGAPASPRHALLPAALGLGVVAASPSARLLGRDGLFGLLAAASGVLAVLFLLIPG